jgi:portal protein
MVYQPNLNNEEHLKGDEKIVAEAHRRFQQGEAWESKARRRYLEDIKFSNADSDNGYQWPNDIRRNRDIDERPCLTINKTHQHNLQIINDAKQNKPRAKVNPVGNGATYEASQVYEGIFRHIEYISNATVAYDTATSFQVQGGIGFWRVVTDYLGNDNFDQEIFIRRIKDPLTVYLDPDINEVDGSDARFGFIFDDMPLDEFRLAYPKYKDKGGQAAIGNTQGWVDKDHVRVAEYYRREENKDQLISFSDPRTGQQQLLKRGKIPAEIIDQVIDNPSSQVREIKTWKVEWYLIIGDEVAERRTWAGEYIPIVRVIGEETIISGELDRKGHTRCLRDPQRMYNYWSSSAVEHVALQSKTPFIAAAAAIENLTEYWETANTVNHSVLPYNAMDDAGNPLPAPARAEPPVMAMAYVQGMKIAQDEMSMVSGQYAGNFGDEKSNEVSGKALQERQRRGENATYHFIDNLAIAIRFTGKILIDLIPKIYDTPRILRIIGEDGEESHVELDPQAQQAYQVKQRIHDAKEQHDVAAIFNPNVGRYDVMADIGPAFQTRRQEAFNAISTVITQSPDVMKIVGDLLFKAADFPMAMEIAERLERMVPPQAKGEGVPPAVMELQNQLHNMQGLLANMTQELGEERLRLKAKDQQKDIDVYEAITKRIGILIKEQINPKDTAMMLHDLMKEEHASGLRQVEAASAADLEDDAAQPTE